MEIQMANAYSKFFVLTPAILLQQKWGNQLLKHYRLKAKRIRMLR
jgi:hypothetical protein